MEIWFFPPHFLVSINECMCAQADQPHGLWPTRLLALSVGFSRQEYWSGLPFPPPGDLPKPGSEPPALVVGGRFFTAETPGKPP